jgi:hypothetical protein
MRTFGEPSLGENLGSQYASQLRKGALSIAVAAPTALGAVALLGTRDELLGMAILVAFAPFLINYLLRRARGESAGYGALTVVPGLNESEIEEIDHAALMVAAIYLVGLLVLALYFVFAYE